MKNLKIRPLMISMLLSVLILSLIIPTGEASDESDAGFNPYTPAVVVDGQITVGIKGDFNNNGRVNIGDVAKVAFMVAGKMPEDLNADFNEKGRVDIDDAAKIAFYLAGKVSEL